MILLEYKGMCEGCECADLELGYNEYGNERKEWYVRCIHVDACDWMETKTLSLATKEKGR